MLRGGDGIGTRHACEEEGKSGEEMEMHSWFCCSGKKTGETVGRFVPLKYCRKKTSDTFKTAIVEEKTTEYLCQSSYLPSKPFLRGVEFYGIESHRSPPDSQDIPSSG